MVLDIGNALWNGVIRTFSRNGLILAGTLFVIHLVFTTAPTAVLTAGTSTAQAAVQNAFALSVLGLIGFIMSAIVMVAAIRYMLADGAELPSTYFTDHIGSATLNLIAGIVVVSIIVSVGFVLIIPGLYLLVSLLFWHIVVVDENEDFIDGLRGSWRITREHMWRLFAMVLGMFAALMVIGIVGGVVAGVVDSIALQTAFSGALGAIGTVYVIAVTADAYKQLTPGPS